MSLHIRAAVDADVPAITRIYNDGIAGRGATFETRPREPDEIRAWLGGPPLLVAERDGAVAGFARVSAYSDRGAYAGVGDYGIYVDAGARGGGVGRRLLEALCDAAETAGYHKLTSKLFTSNAASLALARRCGFREVGTHLAHARLDGRWRDVLVVERLLGPALAVRCGGEPG